MLLPLLIMNAWVAILIVYLLQTGTIFCQSKYCADSSIRIKYTTNNPSFIESQTIPDTSGKNYLIGSFANGANTQRGIQIFKTSWGDSIYWGKKIYNQNKSVSILNINFAPGGTFICNGVWGNSEDIFLCRIDTNGNLLWSNRYRLTVSHPGYSNGQKNYKHILVTNNSIFVNAYFGLYNIVFKLDLNGNLLWSTQFNNSNIQLEGGQIKGAPLISNDTIIVISSYQKQSPVTLYITERFTIITKLNKNTGTLYESTVFKTASDPIIKGLFPEFIVKNKDNTFTLIGSISLSTITGLSQGSSYTFNIQLDNKFNPITSLYYIHDPALLLMGQFFSFDFNSHKKNIFQYNLYFSNDKYFLSFNNNMNIERTRKFVMPPTGIYRDFIKLDDKENVHFTFNYSENGRPVIEYARLSNLAPSNTLNCFGIDTSIFQSVTFTVYRETFTWNVVNSNVLTMLPVNLITESEVINKEVVCKQVSYCDSLKILGSPTVCIGAGNARFSSFLNPQCLKSLNWKFDTSYASLVNYEADSAITLRFKKTGSFYLKAEVNNCVVNDSILVTITNPQTSLQLNKKDSLLCPGGTVVLQANPGFQSYQWQDGSTNSSYNVTATGLYRVTATDSCGNIFSDSMRVDAADTSLNVMPTYSICPYDSAKLLLPSNATNITWQPAASGFLFGNTLSLFPQQTTAYLIEAQIPPGCAIQKNITVVKGDCPEWVRFPSAFTPNADGLNDIFKPGISGTLQSYNLKIFNRSGQLIVNSNNPFEGWDGTFKGKKQNSGVFVFLCSYRFTSGETKMEKGTVMLIR